MGVTSSEMTLGMANLILAKRALKVSNNIQDEVDALVGQEPPTAEEELAKIGALRRELATLERRLEDATDRLKDSPEWDLVQGLKEDRKVLAKKLDRAIDATMSWAQPRMI